MITGLGSMEGGIELFLGVDRDATFGPLVGFGLGGTSVEVLDDVAFLSKESPNP